MEEKAVTTSLDQITLEVKFYLNQTAQNIIEVGKRLSLAKSKLSHGEWQNWLEDNFNLSYSSAAKFMKIAERFSKVESIPFLGTAQMIQLLALPEGEEEKFIEKKKNEGTPVEDMTVKTLREEVVKYKSDLENEKAKNENLFSDFQKLRKHNTELNISYQELKKDNGRLQAKFDTADKLANQYHTERDQLQKQLENQKPVEILPKDYESNKRKISELSNKINQLQDQLKNKIVEVVTPDDYESTKKELAKLQAEKSELVQSMEVFQKLDTVARLIRDISNSPSYIGIENFAREKNDRFGGMCADFKGFIKAYGTLYDKYLEAM